MVRFIFLYYYNLKHPNVLGCFDVIITNCYSAMSRETPEETKEFMSEVTGIPIPKNGVTKAKLNGKFGHLGQGYLVQQSGGTCSQAW